jgi:hypothetical protein
LRKPNYQQQKKSREDARKVRQAKKKEERRQTPATDAVAVDDALNSADKPTSAK